MEDIQVNKMIKKKFRRRVSEYLVGPGETLHVMKPGTDIC